MRRKSFYGAKVAFLLSDWAKVTHYWGEGANLGVVAGLPSLNRFICWPKGQPS